MHPMTRSIKYLRLAATLRPVGLLLAACLGLAGCGQTSIERPHEYDTPVSFSTYSARTASASPRATKAQHGSYIASGGSFRDNDKIGVYAFYHNGALSTDGAWTGSDTPNFMYNQMVECTDAGTSSWTYSPVKYWPNETGGTVSDHADKLSFWGYYPYDGDIDERTLGNGLYFYTATDLATRYSSAASVGLPAVKFTQAEAPGDQIDLMFTLLHKDLVKPGVSDKVTLSFRHAMALVTFELSEGTGATINYMNLTNICRSGVTADPSASPIVWTGQGDSYTFSLNNVVIDGTTIVSLLLMPQTLGAGTSPTQSESVLTLNYDINFASFDPGHPDPIVYSGNEASVPLWSTSSGSEYGVQTWEAGKHYIYKVSAGLDRIEFESAVATDWTIGNDDITVN